MYTIYLVLPVQRYTYVGQTGHLLWLEDTSAVAEHVTIAVMDKPSKQPVDINLDFGIQNILPWSHGLSITAVHVQQAMYDSRLVFLQ